MTINNNPIKYTTAILAIAGIVIALSTLYINDLIDGKIKEHLSVNNHTQSEEIKTLLTQIQIDLAILKTDVKYLKQNKHR